MKHIKVVLALLLVLSLGLGMTNALAEDGPDRSVQQPRSPASASCLYGRESRNPGIRN